MPRTTITLTHGDATLRLDHEHPSLPPAESISDALRGLSDGLGPTLLISASIGPEGARLDAVALGPVQTSRSSVVDVAPAGVERAALLRVREALALARAA